MQIKTIVALVMSFSSVSVMQAILPLHGSFVDQAYRDYPRAAAAITVLGAAGAGAYLGNDLATRINAVPEKARIFAAAGLGTLSAICLISPLMSGKIYWEKIALGLGGASALGVGTASLLTNENTQLLVKEALGNVSPITLACLGGGAGALLTAYTAGIYLNRHNGILDSLQRNNYNPHVVAAERAALLYPIQESGSIRNPSGETIWYGQKIDDDARRVQAEQFVDHYGNQEFAQGARNMFYGSGITVALCLGGATVWEKCYN